MRLKKLLTRYFEEIQGEAKAREDEEIKKDKELIQCEVSAKKKAGKLQMIKVSDKEFNNSLKRQGIDPRYFPSD